MEHELIRADGATELYPGVVVDSRVVHGVPVIKGTRVPVRLILGQLAGGESVESVMKSYALSEEQVRAALGYAAERLSSETVYAVSGE